MEGVTRRPIRPPIWPPMWRLYESRSDVCLHNLCPTCQLGKIDYLDEEKIDSLAVSNAKVDELFGEIEMHVAHISSKGGLAAEAKEELEKFKSGLATLRQGFKCVRLGIDDK